MRRWAIGVMVFLSGAAAGCEAGPDPDGKGPAGLEGALATCGDTPCVIPAYAFADNPEILPIHTGDSLGVFDAGQGGVATWITIVAANVPADNPLVQIQIKTADESLNIPNTLKVPFEPTVKNAYVRDGYMIQFTMPCCADNFQETPGTLEVTLFYDSCDGAPAECGKACDDGSGCASGYLCNGEICQLAPIITEIPILLDEAPWPL